MTAGMAGSAGQISQWKNSPSLYGSAFFTSNSANLRRTTPNSVTKERVTFEGYMACTLDPLTFVV